MAVTLAQMTLEDFLSLPEAEPALEFEDGTVSQKVSPQGQHSRLQSEFMDHIRHQAESRKLAMAFPEIRTSYGERSYVPDIGVYRWDRIPRDATGRIVNDFRDPPDIAVEIVSPEQRVTTLIRKCAWYIEHGVKIAMLIDPEDDSVMLFRPGRPLELLGGDDKIALNDVLPDFDLTVRNLFESLYPD
ncbi:MAG TPA: Uma2 family endonuclease [Thermomicrobiales bacterium]|nr:Uma2 family endonuclease [Thermomicrobiales bacterium]